MPLTHSPRRPVGVGACMIACVFSLSLDAAAEQTHGTLVADNPVAHVDGQPISAKAFNARVAHLHRRLGPKLPFTMLPLYKKRIVDQLVEERLLEILKKKRKITVNDAQVDEALKKYKTKHLNDAAFTAFIKSQYGDMAAFREHVRQQLTRNMVIKSAIRKQVDRKDALAYYNKKKSKHYTIPEQVRASHILLRVPRGSEDKVVLRAFHKAERLVKQARAPGANFEELAKKHSEGPSKTKGGDLGFFTQDKMVKSFGKAAFNLDIGKVSKPVRSQFGYHIIKVYAKRKARLRPFKEVEAEITNGLQSSKNRRTYNNLLKRYTKKVTVEKHLNAIRTR